MNCDTIKFTAKNDKNLVVDKRFVAAVGQDDDVFLYMDGGQYFRLEESFSSAVAKIAACGECVRLHAASTGRPRVAVKAKIMAVEDDDAAGCSYVYLAGGRQYIKCEEDSDAVYAPEQAAA